MKSRHWRVTDTSAYDAGMHGIRLRRPWLWFVAACLLVLLVAGVVFFLPEAPDGSEEVLERVHLGMREYEVESFLTTQKIRWAGYHIQPDGDMAMFRNHVVFFDFDEKKLLVAKSRIRNQEAWYDPLLRYWRLIRSKLGM
jgi:hypothetical protein